MRSSQVYKSHLQRKLLLRHSNGTSEHHNAVKKSYDENTYKEDSSAKRGQTPSHIVHSMPEP